MNIDQLSPAMIKRMAPSDKAALAEWAKRPCLAQPLGLQHAAGAKATITPPPPGQTTDEAGLNKTERRFLDHLKKEGHQWIGIQSITFKLANDCRFTPDLLMTHEGRLHCFDVKGYSKKLGKPLVRDDAAVKIKMAAREFRHLANFWTAYEVNGMWVKQWIQP